MERTLDEMWDALIENAGVSQETLETVTGIYGYNQEVLENVLFYKTGFRDFEQADECDWMF